MKDKSQLNRDFVLCIAHFLYAEELDRKGHSMLTAKDLTDRDEIIRDKMINEPIFSAKVKMLVSHLHGCVDSYEVGVSYEKYSKVKNIEQIMALKEYLPKKFSKIIDENFNKLY